MSAAAAWEGFAVAISAVGSFGEVIRRNLKKARKDEIADAIADAKLKQDLVDAKDALERERRRRRDG